MNLGSPSSGSFFGVVSRDGWEHAAYSNSLLERPVLDSSVGSGSVDWHLALLLILSTVGSLIVFALAATAFRRRKSLPYLLITAALGALVMRPIVGAGTALGYVPMDTHHTVEHLLDVIIAGFLIAAVISVGRLDTDPIRNRDSTDRGDRP